MELGRASTAEGGRRGAGEPFQGTRPDRIHPRGRRARSVGIRTPSCVRHVRPSNRETGPAPFRVHGRSQAYMRAREYYSYLSTKLGTQPYFFGHRHAAVPAGRCRPCAPAQWLTLGPPLLLVRLAAVRPGGCVAPPPWTRSSTDTWRCTITCRCRPRACARSWPVRRPHAPCVAAAGDSANRSRTVGTPSL